MDHLPLPKYRWAEPAQVPYVCITKDPYDGEDFMTYPARRGYPQLLTSHTGVPYWFSSQELTLSDEEIRGQEQILQAWIFFGLLHTTLAPLSLYNACDYIESRDGDDRIWLHTRDITDKFHRWHDAMHDAHATVREAFIQDTSKCIGVAREALLALQNDQYRQFNTMIGKSLAAICSVVEGMVVKLIGDDSRVVAMPLALKLDAPSREKMLHNGWCPSEIAYVEFHSASRSSTLWFAEHVEKNRVHEQHDDCDENGCNRLQIKSEEYVTKHVDDNCQCPEIGPHLDDIVDCLRNGDIPIIEILEGEQEVSINVVPARSMEPNTAYVAISHVWADGLGNPWSEKLPRCQIRRLSSLVQNVKKHTFLQGRVGKEKIIEHKERLLLWCDTLCCPVDRKEKPRALALLRDVYIRSEFVLVLDRDLLCYDYAELDPVEAGWRIVNSRWMRRLWTFQEGGLASRLLIQFKDRPVQLSEIIIALDRLSKNHPFHEQLYTYISANLWVVRKWRHRELQKSWISDAAWGLSHRSVSVSSDEPICLATVLDLGDSIAKVRDHDRQQLLWRNICRHEHGVNKSIVFNTLGRIREPGFRWAPQSFLQPMRNEVDYINVDAVGGKAVLLNRGLRVKCSGWRVCLAERPRAVFTYLSSVPVMHHHEILPARHPDGTCYNIAKVQHDGLPGPQSRMLGYLSDRDREWYIVIQRQGSFEWDRGRSQQNAILVSKEVHPCGLSYFRSHMLVNVDRREPRLELSRQVEYLYARRVRKSWTVMLLHTLLKLEDMLVFISTWMPRILNGFVEPYIKSWIVARGLWLHRRLVNMLLAVKTDALKHREAARIWSKAGDVARYAKLGADVLPAVLGLYVDVVDIYDVNTEWVID